MIAAVMQIVAQTLTAAVAATGRPVTTLFAVQAMVGAAVRSGTVDVHDAMAPVISFVAIGVMGVLAAVENAVQHQSEAAELLDDVYIQRLGGAASAMICALLFGMTSVGGQPSGELWEIIQVATASERPLPLTLAAVGASAVVSLGLGWIRASVLESLRDADMDGPFQWLETGGVFTVLILLPLLPALALLLVLGMSVALTAVGIASRTGGWLLDKASRRPCPDCGGRVRVEACICPHCQSEVEVVHSLAYSLADGLDESPAPA